MSLEAAEDLKETWLRLFPSAREWLNYERKATQKSKLKKLSSDRKAEASWAAKTPCPRCSSKTMRAWEHGIECLMCKVDVTHEVEL